MAKKILGYIKLQVPAGAATPSPPIGPALGRKPISTANATTRARASTAWTMLPSTWPVSTEAREMDMVRKRATMPPVMSMATEMAVPWTTAAIVITRIPGTTYCR